MFLEIYDQERGASPVVAALIYSSVISMAQFKHPFISKHHIKLFEGI